MEKSTQLDKRRILKLMGSTDINYLYHIGSEAAAEGEFDKALGHIEQVLLANPKHARAWNIMGNCLDGLGRYEDALQSYDASLELDPSNADVLFNKAQTLEKMGRDFDAQVLMDKAVKKGNGY